MRGLAASLVKLSVVIPMFNEADNLQSTIDRVAETLRDFAGTWEIVPVNDGSEDGTGAKLAELAETEPYREFLRPVGYRLNRGRGYALRKGFASARGEWIVSTDADLSYEPAYILDLLRVLEEREDIDMVVASAYMPGGGTEGVPFNRLLVSKLGNRILSSFMSSSQQKVHTITCVFRAYRRHVLDSLELESDGKDIHLEIFSKVVMNGYRYVEIPVILRARKQGKSKFRFKHTAASHMVFALFESPILVFSWLGVMALVCSMAALAYVVSDWLINNRFNPDRPMMILIILAFLGGLQLISFGLIGMQIVNLRKELIRMQARQRQIIQRLESSEKE